MVQYRNSIYFGPSGSYRSGERRRDHTTRQRQQLLASWPVNLEAQRWLQHLRNAKPIKRDP